MTQDTLSEMIELLPSTRMRKLQEQVDELTAKLEGDYTLFLDDIRFPEEVRYNYGPYKHIRIARSYEDAVWMVTQYGLPTFISFDHDLADEHYNKESGERTGYSFAQWFCEHVMDNALTLPTDFRFYVHSMNPVGAENIRAYMSNFLRQYDV